MSTAKSRQLPLPSFRVRIGSWVPFSCRATCLKVAPEEEAEGGVVQILHRGRGCRPLRGR